MTKKHSMPTDKAIRGSIYYHINEDGTISQVINHILPTGEKRQIPIHSTPHARVLVTERGLQAQFQFNRSDMTVDDIIRVMYDESDEIMSWLQTDASSAITDADKTFAQQARKKGCSRLEFSIASHHSQS